VFKSGDPTQHIGGSLRTPHHNCWLQMLNLYWRPANPHINLDGVACCAEAIVGLLASAPVRSTGRFKRLGERGFMKALVFCK